MFGNYSNKRLSEAESKILCKNPDDYTWYCVYVSHVFRDQRLFEVREDIELPQDEDDDGVVLIFEGGDIVYFKTLDGDVTEDVVKSVMDVCSYLEKKFNRSITAYVVCPFDCEIKVEDIEGDGQMTFVFSLLRNDDGEEIIDRLESKLKNNEKFTIPDSIDHMLLPYGGFKDKKVFQEKFMRYMNLVEEKGR